MRLLSGTISMIFGMSSMFGAVDGVDACFGIIQDLSVVMRDDLGSGGLAIDMDCAVLVVVGFRECGSFWDCYGAVGVVVSVLSVKGITRVIPWEG